MLFEFDAETLVRGSVPSRAKSLDDLPGQYLKLGYPRKILRCDEIQNAHLMRGSSGELDAGRR